MSEDRKTGKTSKITTTPPKKDAGQKDTGSGGPKLG